MSTESTATEKFDQHVELIRQSGVLGKKGRLLALFDYFAASRGEDSPSEQVLAADVFGRQDFSSNADDSSVRVYVHRLRKKLDEHYALTGAIDGKRLILPRGEYRLLLQVCDNDTNTNTDSSSASMTAASQSRSLWRQRPAIMAAVVIMALVLINTAIWWLVLPRTQASSSTNILWSQLEGSDKPIALVVGDYYVFGEFKDAYLERLIRDFRVDSATDLEEWSKRSPEDFVNNGDIGLTYLPLSIAYALVDIVPHLKQSGRSIQIFTVSEARVSMLKNVDIIYIGLVSGMGFLESLIFEGASYQPGMDYDHIVNMKSNQHYRSNEALGRVEEVVYKDYAYFSMQRTDNGLVISLAGLRDTGLRGLTDLLSRPELPSVFDGSESKQHLEVLFQVEGLQRANIRETVVVDE